MPYYSCCGDYSQLSTSVPIKQPKNKNKKKKKYLTLDLPHQSKWLLLPLDEAIFDVLRPVLNWIVQQFQQFVQYVNGAKSDVAITTKVQ